MATAMRRKVRFFRTATAFWSPMMVVGGVILQTALGHAQNANPSAGTSAGNAGDAFEVASVKRNTSGNPVVQLNPPVGDRFRAVNVTVRMLIMRAYRVKDYQITGGPGWINSERYDITAVAAEPNIDETKYQTLLRSLLADRFQVKLHKGSKEMAVFDLVAVNSGLKLPEGEFSCFEHDSKPPEPVRGQPAPTLCGGFQMDGSHLEGRRISMTQFINAPQVCWVGL